MAELLTSQTIAQRALATLYNTTVLAGLVYRDYDPSFAGKQGDTITIRVPWTPVAKEFDRATGIELQAVNEHPMTLALDTLADVSFPVTTEELTLEIDEFDERMLSPAMEAISQKVDADLATAIVAAATGGTPITVTATAATDVINAPKHPFANGVKVEFPTLTGGGGLTTTADYYVIDAATNTFKVSATRGGAAIDITTDATAGTARAVGGGTVSRAVGEVASDALLRARTVLSANRLPAAERAAVLSAQATEEALSDPLVQQADKSGSTDGLREAAVGRVFGLDTFESQVYAAADGVAFHKQAVALATRTLDKPMGVAQEQVSVANYKGLGLRVVRDYDIDKKQDVVSIDFLYGVRDWRVEGAVALDLAA